MSADRFRGAIVTLLLCAAAFFVGHLVWPQYRSPRASEPVGRYKITHAKIDPYESGVWFLLLDGKTGQVWRGAERSAPAGGRFLVPFPAPVPRLASDTN